MHYSFIAMVLFLLNIIMKNHKIGIKLLENVW